MEYFGGYMNEIQKLKRRLGMAEKALLRIDSLFSQNERPFQIVSEYFETVKELSFDTENTSSNSDYAKCSATIQKLCGALNLNLDNDTDEMKLSHIYSAVIELKSIIRQLNKHFA